MTRVLAELEPQEEVAKSESSGDKGASNDAPTTITEENRGEDDPKNKLFWQEPLLMSEGREEEVQVISYPPRDRVRSPTLEAPF